MLKPIIDATANLIDIIAASMAPTSDRLQRRGDRIARRADRAKTESRKIELAERAWRLYVRAQYLRDRGK